MTFIAQEFFATNSTNEDYISSSQLKVKNDIHGERSLAYNVI